MPRSINDGFQDFHTKLTPNLTESDASKSHRASIEACLKNNYDLRNFFRSGSFGNGTSISGYSDVDYFASLKGDILKENSASTLRLVKETLDNRFPTSGVHVSCPAIVLPFGKNKNESTEVVPADYIRQTDQGHNVYDISDCKGGWMRSSPGTHNAYVTGINKSLGYKVKPLIRFIKAWKYFNNVSISSFYLEMRVAKYCSGEKSIVYSYDLVRIFSLLYTIELASLQDPTGISGYIVPTWSDAKRDDALSKISTALTRAQKAVEAEKAGKISDAFYWWNLIFDNRFPSYYY